METIRLIIEEFCEMSGWSLMWGGIFVFVCFLLAAYCVWQFIEIIFKVIDAEFASRKKSLGVVVKSYSKRIKGRARASNFLIIKINDKDVIFEADISNFDSFAEGTKVMVTYVVMSISRKIYIQGIALV